MSLKSNILVLKARIWRINDPESLLNLSKTMPSHHKHLDNSAFFSPNYKHYCVETTSFLTRKTNLLPRVDAERGSLTPPPLGKLQVVIGFLRNTGTDPHREAIVPLGSNCFSREVRTALCKIHWWLKQNKRKTLSWPQPHASPWRNFLDLPMNTHTLTI